MVDVKSKLKAISDVLLFWDNVGANMLIKTEKKKKSNFLLSWVPDGSASDGWTRKSTFPHRVMRKVPAAWVFMSVHQSSIQKVHGALGMKPSKVYRSATCQPYPPAEIKRR